MMNKVIIGSGNGLMPVWHQAITFTNGDFLCYINQTLGANLYEILILKRNVLESVIITRQIWGIW